METHLIALGQWQLVDGTVSAPTAAVPANPTPDKTRTLATWNVGASGALLYDYGVAIRRIVGTRDV